MYISRDHILSKIKTAYNFVIQKFLKREYRKDCTAIVG